MTAEAIRELLSRRPFAPFVLHMSSGETHEVRHPECVLVTKTRVIVTEPDEDRVAICALLHVASIEHLQTT